MTKFKKLNLREINKGPKETKFLKCVTTNTVDDNEETFPEMYETVIYVGEDISYGDVFIAYDSPNNFVIFFGEAGDEFKDNGE